MIENNENMSEQNAKKSLLLRSGIWTSIFTAIGTAIGVYFDNFAFGLYIGLITGLVVQFLVFVIYRLIKSNKKTI